MLVRVTTSAAVQQVKRCLKTPNIDSPKFLQKLLDVLYNGNKPHLVLIPLAMEEGKSSMLWRSVTYCHMLKHKINLGLTTK